MKTNEKKQLNSKTKEELLMQLREVDSDLIRAQMDHSQHKLKNTRLLRKLRDNRARIKGAQNQLEDKNG